MNKKGQSSREKKWTKYLKRNCTKEYIQKTNKHMNMSSTLLGTREMQIKPQWDTTAHSPEWLQFKNLTILSVDNNLEQWKSVNWCNTLENCLAASTKVEHVQPLWLSDPTTNRNACTCVPNKNICRNVRPNSS